MKYIIFDIKNKKAVALDGEGRFVNLKNKGYALGEEIELDRLSDNTPYRKFATIAIALVIVIILAVGGISGGLYYDANIKTAYTVQIDINPSVTIYLNSKDVVIKAEANNADGAALNPNDFKGETLDNFIEKYVERFVESDIFDAETEYTVKIAVDGKTEKAADTTEISTRAESAVRKEFENKGVSVAAQTENESKEPTPKTWTYSYYDKLNSDVAISTEILTDGTVIQKPSDSPVSADDEYSFVLWWDGNTKEDSGKPVDFFASGERAITSDTEIVAVWTKNGGYTVDGETWLINPTSVRVQFVLVYPDEAGKPDEILSDGKLSSYELMESKAPSNDELDNKLKLANLSGSYSFAFWSLTKDGSAGDYFETEKILVDDVILYAVLDIN